MLAHVLSIAQWQSSPMDNQKCPMCMCVLDFLRSFILHTKDVKHFAN